MTSSLPQVSNDHLISQLKSLVLREREMLLEILKYLREVEARQLHLKLGYPSLHAFMTQHLAYSEGAAGRRILAMRLMKSLPEVAPKIQKGELSLSVASQVQGFIQREEKQRKITKHEPLKPLEKLNLLTQLQGTSSRECERRLVQLAPETGLPNEKTRPLSEEKSLIQFVAGRELIQKLEKLKSLTSHSNPEGKYELLFSKLADLALDRLDPERRAKRREDRERRWKAKEKLSPPAPESENKARKNGQSSPSNATPTLERRRSRYIPQRIKDEIQQRDGGRCQYQNPKTGRKCRSTYQLELDHRYPFSLGGEHSEKNLRLYCRRHNQFRYLTVESGSAQELTL